MVRCVVSLDCLDENTIVRFFRSELSPSELSGVDRHIDRCAVCRMLLSSLASTEMTAGPFSAAKFAAGAKDAPPASFEAEPSPSREPLAPGVVLSQRFAVEELVGVGGMAQVFRGLDRKTGSQVAIKVTQGRSREETERSEREAKLLLQLQHPSIVRHIADGRAPDETPYLVMEWLDGEDLATRLHRGPLDVAETVTLGVRVAGALAAAHALGVVHRDIKPSNIYLRSGQVAQATVLDFGVARPSWHQGASFATRTGALLGTLGYMAPEQALGAKTADARADIFSLGCVLFECLVGRRLFGGSHAVEVLANLLTQPIQHPRDHVPGVPEALDALIVRMLSRDRAARPPDCATIAASLERISTMESGGSKRRGRLGLTLIAAALVLVPAGIVLASHLRAPITRVGANAAPTPGPSSDPGSPASTGSALAPAMAAGAPASAPPPKPTASTTGAGPVPAGSPREPPLRTMPRASSDPFGTFRN
jgi:hypothetical protein